MSKVDRFIEALTADVDPTASFMGLNIPTALTMIRAMASEDELEKFIDSAVNTWQSL